MIKNKKAQESGVGMSFGFIFSILLIIIFVLAAIWGINFFLDLNRCSQIGFAYESLQKEITTAYQSSLYLKEYKFDFSGAEKICFGNLTEGITSNLEVYEEIQIFDIHEANTFLYPIKKACGIPYKNIRFLNISEITKNKNPICFDVNEKVIIEFDPQKTGRGVLIREI